MKKVLLSLMMLMAGMAINAQVPDVDSAAIIIKEKGVYEQKRVVTVDGAKASSLYRRAMEALSDWTGTEGRSKAGLDYCDKDEGIVTYKGEFYNGYRQLAFGQLPFYTDFTMKIRCKDGRAQITVIVPTMHAILANGQTRTWTVKEIIEANEKANPKKMAKAKKKTHATTTREIVELLLTEMETALKKDPDDDF
jgi:predicted DNA-binding protein